MRNNFTATAGEILKSVGDSFQVGEQTYSPEEVFGKTRIRIGGVPASTPNHLIRVPADAATLEVIVGDQTFPQELRSEPEHKHTAAAHQALEELGHSRVKATQPEPELEETIEAPVAEAQPEPEADTIETI